MKIALMGSHPESAALAPFMDKSHAEFQQGLVQTYPPSPFQDEKWDLWPCSPGAMAVAVRATRWFEVHRWEPGQAWFSPQYVQMLQEFKGPVYVGGEITEIQNAVIYPLKRVEAEFSSAFLTSSLSLMAALAILTIEDLRELRKINKVEGMPAPAAWLRLKAMGMPEDQIDEEWKVKDEDDEIGWWGVDMSANEEYCVAPETRVLTADLRWVRADSLKVGDKVMAFDEEKGGGANSPTAFRQWKVAVVEAVPRLTRPCYEIELEDGTTLVSSAEHRWLTYAEHENRWCRTDRLITPAHREDRPTRIVKLTDTWEENRSWDAGYLAAAFDGEGYIGQIDRSNCNGRTLALGYGQRDNAMSDEVIAACERLGFALSVPSAKVVNGPFDGTCHNYRILGGRAEVMKFLGSIRPRRLLDNFDPSRLAVMHRKDAVAVKSAKPIGEREVIGLATSAHTFVAEGFASHNSRQKPGAWFFGLEILRRGIAMRYPPESDLFCFEPVYGLSEWDPEYVKATCRMREFNKRMAAQQQEHANLTQQLAANAGAKDNLQYHIKTNMNPFRLPAGVKISLKPGTGMGAGQTDTDRYPSYK